MQKLRMGIIGCGRVSDCHFEAVKNNSDTMEMVAVCDINPTNLQKAQQKTGANPYTNIDDMLKFEKLDCVSICTPNGFHYENARKVLKAGMNVIVEKPLTLSLKEGKKLMSLAKRNCFLTSTHPRNCQLPITPPYHL